MVTTTLCFAFFKASSTAALLWMCDIEKGKMENESETPKTKQYCTVPFSTVLYWYR